MAHSINSIEYLTEFVFIEWCGVRSYIWALLMHLLEILKKISHTRRAYERVDRSNMAETNNSALPMAYPPTSQAHPIYTGIHWVKLKHQLCFSWYIPNRWSWFAWNHIDDGWFFRCRSFEYIWKRTCIDTPSNQMH